MFNTFEISRFLGRKRQLFEFEMQNRVWRFAAGDRDVPIGGNTYTAATIARSSIKESSERAKNNITITLPYLLNPNAPVGERPSTQSFGDMWRPFPPSDVMFVKCLAYHANDPDLQVVTEWYGRVVQPQFTDIQLQLTCQPSRSRAQFMGLGMRWQRGCPLVLYSQGLGMCNADKEANAVPATLSASIDGLILTAPEFAASPKSLAGGFIEWTDAFGTLQRRSIMAHSGTQIEVNYSSNDFDAGLDLIAYPGCPHNWAGCESFDNTPNYGGALFLPIQNPYSGNPVW